jgi:hypothetical protein
MDLDECDKKELIELGKINAKIEVGPVDSLLAQLKIRSVFRDRILEAQMRDAKVKKVRDKVESGAETPFQVLNDGMVVMGRRMYLPGDKVLKEEVLKEAHESRFTVHPGRTKMYRDLREFYWWPKMKKEIAEYVTGCSVCQQVKIEHQKPAGPLQPLLIPQWKWEDIKMDFVSGLQRGRKGNDAIWVIVDRLTKFALFFSHEDDGSSRQTSEAICE